jgi:hypothetical protein
VERVRGGIRRRAVASALLVLGLAWLAPAAGAATGGAPAGTRASFNCTTTTTITYGAKPTKGVIGSAGADACFTFSTAEGDVVWDDLAVTSGSVSLFIDIYRPGAISTCAGPYGGPGDCPVPAGGSGTWTLQVSDSSGTHTGKFNVSVQRLNVGAKCKPLTFGHSAIKGKISAPAGSSCFTFSGDPSDYLFAHAVGITGKLGTPTLLLAGPDGSEPCSINEFGFQECPLTESGPQTLLVYSSLETPTGSFRISDQQLTSPQRCTALVADGPSQAGSIAQSGDVACFTFAGTSGETATFTVSNVTGTLSPLIDDFRPTGSSACAGPNLANVCPLDTTGTWTTIIWDNSASSRGTGTFTATLTD